MELISIIVLTYNSEKTVIETLESIRTQTYPNIEIIVSDDCSSDDTLFLVQQWFNLNKVRGKILSSKKNMGISFNYNKGIRASSGKLIKGIAGDDILYPNAIKRYFYAYEMDCDCIWVAKCKCFGDDLDRINVVQKYFDDYSFYNKTCREQYNQLILKNKIMAPGIGLINKDLFANFGYFDEVYPLLEDYPFNLKMSENGVRYRLIEDFLIGYRVSSSSVSGNVPVNYLKCMQKFFFRKRFVRLITHFYFKSVLKEFIFYTLLYFGYLLNRNENNHLILRKIR